MSWFENVARTRIVLPALLTAASGATVMDVVDMNVVAALEVGTEEEVEVEVEAEAELEAEMEVEVGAEVEVEAEVESANASTPSLELPIHTGTKSDQIEFNNNKISHAGTGETQKPSVGLVVQASAMSIAMPTVGISNILPARQGLFPLLYFFTIIDSIVRGTCNRFHLMTER